MEKMTKREMFAMVREIVEASEAEDVVTLVEFLDHEVELLDNKAAKSKERAAKRKAEGDALRAVVESVLTEDFQTVDAITEAVLAVDETVTKSKVVSRLTGLVKNGLAEKAEVKTEDGRKVSAYAAAANQMPLAE